jgi:hypothetical protein
MQSRQHVIILGREPGAERFEKIRIFGSEEGLDLVMLRKSSRSKGIDALDLFDEAELLLEKKSTGGLAFIKEARCLQRHSTISKNYPRFEAAAWFAKAVYLNAQHMSNAEGVFDLLKRSFAAWNEEKPTHIVLFKALFLLAHEDGFPVKERWMLRLEEEQTSKAVLILNGKPEANAHLDHEAQALWVQLSDWLKHEQDFRF